MPSRGRHQSTSKECRRTLRKIEAIPGVVGVIIGMSFGGKSLGQGMATGSGRIQRTEKAGLKAVIQSEQLSFPPGPTTGSFNGLQPKSRSPAAPLSGSPGESQKRGTENQFHKSLLVKYIVGIAGWVAHALYFIFNGRGAARGLS